MCLNDISSNVYFDICCNVVYASYVTMEMNISSNSNHAITSR